MTQGRPADRHDPLRILSGDASRLASFCRDAARREKEDAGRPVMGTLCSHIPVEILHAGGILPLRLWGEAKDGTAADRLLPSFVCPPVRHLMALGLEGAYDFLDGLIHSYTCDAACGLFNLWRRNLPVPFHRLLSLPYMDTPEAAACATEELRGFVQALEQFTGRSIPDERLAASIGLYNGVREALRALYLRKKDGAAIPYGDIHRWNMACQTLPVETVLPALRAYGEARGGAGEATAKRRILLSGSVIVDAELPSLIEALGGEIAADDTCLGWRIVRNSVSETGNPLSALAGHLLRRPPCASRADFPGRERFFRETLAAFRIEAVIFVYRPFCDPHLSDLPFLKRLLAAEKIPCLVLEQEGGALTGRIRTALEAFFEVISS